MTPFRPVHLVSLALVALTGIACSPQTPPLGKADVLLVPNDRKFTQKSAQQMIRASQTTLSPIYAHLAEQMVEDLGLAGREGIGIDLGSGPGTLIVELCKRTKMHWVNADINPYFFGPFYTEAAKHGLAHRVSAIFADAHALPFRDDYADVIVSRGAYHFWNNKPSAFGEILRVLKPDGVAYIGRGFSANLPAETARKIRAKQGKKMKYDLDAKTAELEGIMKQTGIRDYRIHRPSPPDASHVNYGIWIEFRKAG